MSKKKKPDFSKKYEEYNTYDEDLKQFFLDLNARNSGRKRI